MANFTKSPGAPQPTRTLANNQRVPSECLAGPRLSPAIPHESVAQILGRFRSPYPSEQWQVKLARHGQDAEIFLSIQGEGRSQGRPSIFVRTSHCNLHCVWCDTDYTWNWEGTSFRHRRDAESGPVKYRREDEVLDLPVAEVVERIQAFPCRNVVWTGGEPLLHQPDLFEAMRRLRAVDARYWFEVETNGTLVPDEPLDRMVEQYNVSPKLAGAEVAQRLREKPEALQFFSRCNRAYFKFVVTAPPDIDEVVSLAARYEIAPERIYLMPEGTDDEQLRAHGAWVAEQCLRLGYNFTDRLHVRLWGNRRGV